MAERKMSNWKDANMPPKAKEGWTHTRQVVLHYPSTSHKEEKEKQRIELPKAHKILTVQLQNEVPCMWVEVDTDSPTEPVTILWYGTGWDIEPANTTYIGTIQQRGYVWHYYKQN